MKKELLLCILQDWLLKLFGKEGQGNHIAKLTSLKITLAPISCLYLQIGGIMWIPKLPGMHSTCSFWCHLIVLVFDIALWFPYDFQFVPRMIAPQPRQIIIPGPVQSSATYPGQQTNVNTAAMQGITNNVLRMQGPSGQIMQAVITPVVSAPLTHMLY